MQFTSIVLLVLAAAVQGNTPTVEPGFTSLFNGKDLTGWKIAGSPEAFKLADGAIVASGPASHAYYDGSFRNHRFRNFELRVDVLVRTGGNGGVYVLTDFEEVGGNERASGRFPSKGFEIQAYKRHRRTTNRESLSRRRRRRTSRQGWGVVYRDDCRPERHDRRQG